MIGSCEKGVKRRLSLMTIEKGKIYNIKSNADLISKVTKSLFLCLKNVKSANKRNFKYSSIRYVYVKDTISCFKAESCLFFIESNDDFTKLSIVL